MNFRIIVAALLFLLMTTSVYSEDAALVGEWETEPSSTRMGNVIINYNFINDDTYTLMVSFLDIPMPPSVTDGSYSAEGGDLILKDDGKVFPLKYYFKEGSLFIEEKGGTYRYSKKDPSLHSE